MHLYTNATFLFSQSIVFARRRSCQKVLLLTITIATRGTHLYLSSLICTLPQYTTWTPTPFLLTIITLRHHTFLWFCTTSPVAVPAPSITICDTIKTTFRFCIPSPVTMQQQLDAFLFLCWHQPIHNFLPVLHNHPPSHVHNNWNLHHFHCYQSSPVTTFNNLLILHSITCHNANNKSIPTTLLSTYLLILHHTTPLLCATLDHLFPWLTIISLPFSICITIPHIVHVSVYNIFNGVDPFTVDGSSPWMFLFLYL